MKDIDRLNMCKGCKHNKGWMKFNKICGTCRDGKWMKFNKKKITQE